MKKLGILTAGLMFLAACQQTTSNQSSKPATQAQPAPAAKTETATKPAPAPKPAVAAASAETVSYAAVPRMDRHGNMLVDGKPFLPIGIYSVPKDKMSRVRDLGFNTILTYSAEGNVKWQNSVAPVEKLSAYLQSAEAEGLKVVMGLPRQAIKKWNAKLLRPRVDILRHEPALLTWYLFDEPDSPGHKIPPQNLAKLSSLVGEVDGSRPTVIVVSELEDGLHRQDFDHANIAMVDPYVYRNKKSNISGVFKEVSGARLGTRGKKPVWAALQIHGKGGRGYGYLEPPFKVMRNMTYQAVAGGARAIFYFTYRGSQFEVEKSAFAAKNLKRITAELRRLAPVILAPTVVSPPVRVISTSRVVFRAFVHEGAAWLLVVNSGNGAAGYTVRATSGDLPASLDLPFENRQLQTTDGVLRDNLDGLGVRIYRYRLGPPATS